MADVKKTHEEQIAFLRKIVENATAFFVTNSADRLHGRPMQTARVEDGLRSLWFACNRDSEVARESSDGREVLLGYANSTGAEWATINGVSKLVTDRAVIKEMWSPIWKNWFEGPDDPRIVLIKVIPQSADYWDAGSRVVQLLKFAYTAVSGVKTDDGEHGTVALNEAAAR